MRGYFYAGSSAKDTLALGGYYEDRNRPKPINSWIKSLSNQDSFQLIAKPDTAAAFKAKVSGFKVFLVNNTDTIVTLEAQDSRLYLKRQVYYKNKWRDIEYIPSSWCGNSYHTVSINPKEFWEFTAPCLQGKHFGKFRFKLALNKENTIYSNVFEGSFNLRQMKKEQGHKPAGLMDPYNN